MQTPSIPETHSWRELRAIADDVARTFGAPHVLARRRLTPHGAKRLRTTLLALEAWLRRLLLILAARIALPPRRESVARAAHAPAPCVVLADDDSAAWRAPFALGIASNVAPARETLHPLLRPRAKQPNPEQSQRRAITLAVRYEALLRAVRDPERSARRMARALARQPSLPRRLLQASPRRYGPLETHVAEAEFLVLDAFPDALRDTS